MDSKTGAYKAIFIFGVVCLCQIFYLYLSSPKFVAPIASNQISVLFYWPNQEAEIIEANVTSAYESAICMLKGINNISSATSAGSGVIHVTVDNDEDVHQLRYEISTTLQSLYKRMPKEVSYPIVTAAPQNNLSKERVDLKLLLPSIDPVRTTVLMKLIANTFQSDASVSEVVFPKTPFNRYIITLKENVLAQYKISQTELLSCLSETSDNLKLNLSNKFQNIIDSHNFLVTNSLSLLDMEVLPITTLSGKRLYLRDIAWVSCSEVEITDHHTLNGYHVIDFQIYTSKGTTAELLRIEQIRNKIASMLDIGEHIVDTENRAYSRHRSEVNFLWTAVITVIIVTVLVCVCTLSWPHVVTFLCCVLAIALTQLIAGRLLNNPFSVINITAFILTVVLIGSRLITFRSQNLARNYVPDISLIPELFIVIPMLALQTFFRSSSHDLVGFLYLMLPGYISSYFILIFVFPALLLFLPRLKSPGIQKVSIYFLCFFRPYPITILGVMSTRFRFFILLLILGVPSFLLPRKLDPSTTFAQVYNNTLGNDFYTFKIRKYVDPALGGVIKLFIESRKIGDLPIADQTKPLNVEVNFSAASNMPIASRIRHQIEEMILRYPYLTKLEIEASDSRSIKFQIWFSPAAIRRNVPTHLRNVLQRFAVDNGIATFRIVGWGLPFDNDANEAVKGYGIVVKGFQYKTLKEIAHQVVLKLRANPRVRNVEVANQRTESNLDNKYNPTFIVSKAQLIQGSKSKIQNSLIDHLRKRDIRGIQVDEIINGKQINPIILRNPTASASMWEFISSPINVVGSTKSFKISSLGSFVNVRSNEAIQRIDQQYQLAINYDYLGDEFIASLSRGRVIDSIKNKLPIGFYISDSEEDEAYEGPKILWAISIYSTLLGVFLLTSILTNNFRFSCRLLFFITFSIAGGLFFITMAHSASTFNEFGILGLTSIILIPGLIQDHDLGRQESKKKVGRRFLLFNSSCIIGILPVLFISDVWEFQFHLFAAIAGTFAFAIVLYFLFFTPYKRSSDVQIPF